MEEEEEEEEEEEAWEVAEVRETAPLSGCNHNYHPPTGGGNGIGNNRRRLLSK